VRWIHKKQVQVSFFYFTFFSFFFSTSYEHIKDHFSRKGSNQIIKTNQLPCLIKKYDTFMIKAGFNFYVFRKLDMYIFFIIGKKDIKEKGRCIYVPVWRHSAMCSYDFLALLLTRWFEMRIDGCNVWRWIGFLTGWLVCWDVNMRSYWMSYYDNELTVEIIREFSWVRNWI